MGYEHYKAPFLIAILNQIILGNLTNVTSRSVLGACIAGHGRRAVGYGTRLCVLHKYRRSNGCVDLHAGMRCAWLDIYFWISNGLRLVASGTRPIKHEKINHSLAHSCATYWIPTLMDDKDRESMLQLVSFMAKKGESLRAHVCIVIYWTVMRSSLIAMMLDRWKF